MVTSFFDKVAGEGLNQAIDNFGQLFDIPDGTTAWSANQAHLADVNRMQASVDMGQFPKADSIMSLDGTAASSAHGTMAASPPLGAESAGLGATATGPMGVENAGIGAPASGAVPNMTEINLPTPDGMNLHLDANSLSLGLDKALGAIPGADQILSPLISMIAKMPTPMGFIDQILQFLQAFFSPENFAQMLDPAAMYLEAHAADLGSKLLQQI